MPPGLAGVAGARYDSPMPMTYRIDLANCVVWTRAWGELTDEELVAHARHLRADPRFAPNFRQFFSAEASTGGAAGVSREGLRQAAQLNPFGEGARRAVVADNDVAVGLARMYEMMRGDAADVMMGFRDRAAALEWLGLPATWEPPPAAPSDPILDSSHP